MKPALWQPTTSFVGRENDLIAVAARLEEGRLVTVLGPGGMGKTRLALRFASEWEGETRLCDLSDANSAADVCAVLAATLGVRVDDGEAAIDRALGGCGRVLVVLDNFDRLVDIAAVTIGRWMHAAPSARFLVTSRAALGLPGEALWTLGPLGLDEAVELFATRARQVQPGFEATRERAIVEAIARAVDCMPLAIELASTRMTALSATQLAQRLARPLEILEGKREPVRHESVRRTIVDSVDVLDAHARRVFAAASLLRNRFTVEAAEEILGDVVTPRARVLSDLETLVRTSLLRVTIEPNEPARHGFFETIRDVAEELARDESERDAIKLRAVRYYAMLASRRRATPADLENLLAAHATACAAAMPQAMDIVLGIEPLLFSRGQNRLLVMLVDAALAVLDRVDDDAHTARARAEALLARGRARRELGDFVGARDDFQRARDLARDPELTAVALTRLGMVEDHAGDTRAARALFGDALTLFREAPESPTRMRREADAWLSLGHALRREGDLEPARRAIVQAALHHRALGNAEGLAAALYEQAVVEMFAGDHAAAFARFDEGLDVAERGGVRVLYGACKTARGSLLQEGGRLEEALEHHAEAARVFHELGTRYREASALYYLATTYLERGETLETLAVLGRARRALEGVGVARYEALIAGCTASAFGALGDFVRAREAIAEAERAAAKVSGEPALAATVDLHRDALDVRERDATDRDALLARAAARVAEDASDDSRFALRMLRRACSKERPPSTEAHARLVIAKDGGSFRLPGTAEDVIIPERSPLRRILAHLAERRVEAAGEAVTIDDVIHVGWPDEKIAAAAALNRAHVALASLRKLGLRGLLVKTAGGYAISEAAVVTIKGD